MEGIGAFLIFEFGRVRKNEYGTKCGTYTLWIYMATWRVYKGRRELAHSESPDKTINRTAETLTGKKLEAIVLNTVVLKNKLRYGATFHFEGGFRLQVYMYDRGNYETIFMLYTADEVVSYDYDGVIRTETIEA